MLCSVLKFVDTHVLLEAADAEFQSRHSRISPQVFTSATNLSFVASPSVIAITTYFIVKCIPFFLHLLVRVKLVMKLVNFSYSEVSDAPLSSNYKQHAWRLHQKNEHRWQNPCVQYGLWCKRWILDVVSGVRVVLWWIRVQELDPILREGLVVSDDERRGGSDHGDHNQPLTSQLFLLVQFLNQKKTVALGAEPPRTSHQAPLKGITWIHTFLHGSPHLCIIHQYICFQQFLCRKQQCNMWRLWTQMWQSKGLWRSMNHIDALSP